MILSTNIICASLNYQRLDDRAIFNLKQADLSIDQKDLRLLLDEIGLNLDALAVIKKCNALMVLIEYSDDLAQDYVRGRLLQAWDKLSDQGITALKRDIKFYENVDALKFIAECAVGVHSVTVGDSQVLSQVLEGLRSNLSITGKSVFNFIADWLQELAEECRHKTDLFKGNTSLERIASELVLKKIENDKVTILVGYGRSGKLVAKVINQENGLPIHIINRTEVSLKEGGLGNNSTYSSFESFVRPKNVGAVIIAIDSTEVTQNLVLKLIEKIIDKDVFFLDLSTPSILKGKVNSVVDISELSHIAEQTIGARKDSVNKARKIIENDLKQVVSRINSYFATLYVNAQRNVVVPLNDKERERLIRERSEMFKHIRSELNDGDFLEAITPFIVGISTDPPKVDKGGTIDVDWMNGARAFLRQSNQIYKQIYVASGIEKMYEIGPFWRKETSESYRHLQESIGLDVEMQNPQNLQELYEQACKLIKSTNNYLVGQCKVTNHLHIPDIENIPVLTYHEAVELLRENGNPITRGEDFGLVSEAKLGQLVKKSSGSDIFVIKDFPDTIKKFYTKQKEDGLTETFDVIVDGWELVSGAIRQTEGNLIRKSMQLSDINPSDYEFYINLVDGAPEHGGFCLGLDRLLAKILDKEMVSDAVPFPRTYKRLIP
jgi:nondiscriminating aspartyl-tRNA synthetase